MPSVDIEISEVGPRDGLQSIERPMPLDARMAWISAEAAAGVREIEVGSFVSAKLLPQMRDTAAVAAHALTISGLRVAVLVPNQRGAEDAIRAAVHKISIPVSVSETHSRANLNRDHDQMIEEVRNIRALIDALPEGARPYFEGGLSTAFGCTLEGPQTEDKVVRLAGRLMQAGCDEVGLSDTTGYADPGAVKRLVRAVKREVGDDKLNGLHLHNTRGLGMANALAGIEAGITTLDASLGGLGGCPFAPGASGNIVTEDLVFMLEAMGLNTGIDLEALMRVREIVKAALPGEELFGFLPDAGLPMGFSAAAS